MVLELDALRTDARLRGFTCDTMTGKTIATLPLTGPTFAMRLNKAGTITAEINCFSDEAQAVNIRETTAGIRRSLGVAFGTDILECGPIIGRDYDADTGMLSLTADGLWSVFDGRAVLASDMLHESQRDKVTGSQVTYGPASLSTIAREIVRVSLQDNPYGTGGLNIVLPAPIAGLETETFAGYDLIQQGDALRQLTQREDGPDIRFRPRFMDADQTRVEWVMETGTPTRPILQQKGELWQWDGSAPESGVVKFGTSEDFAGLAQRVWVAGQGQESKMPLGQHTDTRLGAAGYPWLEQVHAEKQVADLRTLNSLAVRLTDEAADPRATISVVVRADYFPFLGTYQPGDLARIIIPENHPTLNPGPTDVRIMAIDGTDSLEVRLSVEPMAGTIEGSPVPDGTTRPEPSPDIYPGTTTFPGYSIYPS